MLTINARWTIWSDNGDYVHIQVPGHPKGRDYGIVVDVKGMTSEVMGLLIPDNATHSFNSNSKVYSNCVLRFDGSPQLLLAVGVVEICIPISGTIYKWLIEESKLKS